MSVTAEPPGTNCLAGGQRISSASGTSYICNASVPAVAHLQGADFPVEAFPINTYLPVDFTATPYSNDLAGADLTNNRFVVPSAGLYSVTGAAQFCPQATYGSTVLINLNGNTVKNENSAHAFGCRTVRAQETLNLVQGDIITMEVLASANGPTYGINGIMLTVIKLR